MYRMSHKSGTIREFGYLAKYRKVKTEKLVHIMLLEYQGFDFLPISIRYVVMLFISSTVKTFRRCCHFEVTAKGGRVCPRSGGRDSR